MASVRKKSMVPFIGGSYDMLTKKISTQQCINCYIEKQDGMNTKYNMSLVGTPGTKLWLDLGSDFADTWCRGLFTSATGVMFAVFGTKLVKVNPNGSWDLISSSIAGSSIGRVSFAESVFYLKLCDGVQMYSYNYSTEVFSIDDYPDNAKPKQVAWIGNRMIAINAGVTDAQKNQVFYTAAPLDATDTSHVTDWSITNGGGNFSAIQSADSITSMQISNGYIWLFGERSYEIHRPTFDASDPFDLIDSTTNAVGCAAPLGSVEIANTIYWFGSAQAGTQQIFASNGLGYQVISTNAIENDIADFYSKGIVMDDVRVYSYSQAGHVFVVFNFVAANICWVYDTSTGLWHQRTSYDDTTTTLDRWTYLWTVEFKNKILTTAPNGKILELDINTYSDYDEAKGSRLLEMQYTGPVYWDNLDKVVIDELQIDMEVGVGYGQPTDQSYNPKMVVETSRDGGVSFRNARLYEMGKKGEYSKTVRVRKLGMSREHVVRIRISDPVLRAIYGARLTSVSAGN